MFCFCGEMVTYQFEAFDEELCMRNWYTFPVELQRMMIVFMAGTQQSIHIRGFANTICTREAFKRVNGLIQLRFIQN